MPTPVVAYRKGFYREAKAGERYLWCSCGRSANQPFCDGSHRGSEFKPVPLTCRADADVIFCGCKHTRTPPFCDGSHNNLPGGSSDDDPDSPANRAIATVRHGADAKIPLDGRCYVFSTARAGLERRGTLAWCTVIGPATGAEFQSQFYAEADEGLSPILDSGDAHCILFMVEGKGEVAIAGRCFPFGPRTGLYVRPGEAFRIRNTAPDAVKFFVSTGPGRQEPIWLEHMPDVFDTRFPMRTAEIDPAQGHAMAERWFQLLINREHGSTEMTQFIGNIPRSKAEPHRHLYEEALIFLNGGGVVWTERTKTRVSAGDVLFLPRKLAHSVQCTVDGGFDVVGVICPGDNPAVSY